ncbi:hypothetical protein [Ralstonia pseudosolanacearum]|uniref:hypothetical protein n=1 Tax=Ralstonia pseudosolanacearum TaxID=1310165 RepID=UPI003CE78AA8
MSEQNLIRCISTRYPDPGEASDAHAGSSCVPGFRFGYVDQNHRVVVFFDDAHPQQPLPERKGLLRVTARVSLPQLQG